MSSWFVSSKNQEELSGWWRNYRLKLVIPHPRYAQEVELHSHLTTISLLFNVDINDNFKGLQGIHRCEPSNLARHGKSWGQDNQLKSGWMLSGSRERYQKHTSRCGWPTMIDSQRDKGLRFGECMSQSHVLSAP